VHEHGSVDGNEVVGERGTISERAPR
jgi:hypothetical protein